MVTTEVVSTNWYWTGYGNGEVRKWQDGTYHKWQAERWQELSVDEVAQYVPIDQIWEDQAIEEEYDMLYWRKDKHKYKTCKKNMGESSLEFHAFCSGVRGGTGLRRRERGRIF